MKRLIALFSLLAVLAPAAHAANPGVYLGLGLSSGTADLATEDTGYANAYDHSEYGVQFSYWNMMAKDYAFAASFGLGTFKETQKPGDNAPAGSGEFEYSQSSWNVRIGGDRVVRVGERAFLFFGPGIEYWNGKAKFELGTASAETEPVTRISLHGRVGASMMMGDNYGLTVSVGSKVGRASYTELGAEDTWFPSSMDGSIGLVYRLGGK